jgi:hypothetical protein
VCRKDYGWSVGLVYDHRGLPGVRPPGPGWLGCYSGGGDEADTP